MEQEQESVYLPADICAINQNPYEDKGELQTDDIDALSTVVGKVGSISSPYLLVALSIVVGEVGSPISFGALSIVVGKVGSISLAQLGCV